MTETTENEVTITIDFEEAMQAIAYLSDMLEFLESKNLAEAAQTQTRHVKTAKEICEAFCCEHFRDELEEEDEPDK